MKKLFILFLLVITIFTVQAKDKIVILSFKASNVSIGLAEAVTENIITAFPNYDKYQVVERIQLDKILSELKLSASDDFDESYALEVGKLASAKLILIGSLTKIGSDYTINARCIDVETGNIVIAKNIQVPSENELLQAIENLVKTISEIDIELLSSKDKIVILNLRAVNYSKGIASAVTENLITEIVNLKTYQVIERSQIDKIFDELKLSGTEDFSEDTAFEVGKLSNAKLVLLGSITKLGDNITINIRGIDVETGNVTFGDKIVTTDQDGLYKATKLIARNICLNEKRDETVTIIDTKKEKQQERLKKSINGYRKEGFIFLRIGLPIAIFGTGMLTSGIVVASINTTFTKKYPLTNVAYDGSTVSKFPSSGEEPWDWVYSISFTVIGTIISVGGIVVSLISIKPFYEMKDEKKQLKKLQATSFSPIIDISSNGEARFGMSIRL